MRFPSSTRLACLFLLACAVGCRREQSGQTAILLDLATRGPVQCVVVTAVAGVDGGGGQPIRQSLELGSGLPDDFGKSDKPGWTRARLSALVYSGGPLGSGAITLAAEGHRGKCGGPLVAAFGPVTLQFTQGEVTPEAAVLALKGSDADGDGFAAPEDCNDHDPTIYPGAPELCDGKDHSCSGVIDKGCPCSSGPRACYPLGLSSTTLGVGVCHAGTQSCLQGRWGTTCDGAVTPQPERCDGQDHDCDGTIGLPSCPCAPGDQQQCYTKGPAAQAGVGRCKAGQRTCGSNGFYGPCVGDVGPLPYEICNGIDDNCDGRVDEEFDENHKPVMVGRPPCGNQKGVCAGSRQTCVNGAFNSACGIAEYQASAIDHGTYYGADTACTDGIDHDCDGIIGAPGCQGCDAIGAERDCYGPGLGSPDLQHGPCHAGRQTCISHNGVLSWSACANQLLPQQEICDGKDNDCNGLVDDLVVGEGAACATGQPGVCAQGFKSCEAGAFRCAPLTAPSPEICDGLDNNCNGQVDEGFDKQHDPQHCGGAFDCTACAQGDACCGGRCGNLQSDPQNCGACGNACAGNAACCAGKCVAVDSAQNCGACGKACATGEQCQAGQCVLPACSPGGPVDCTKASCEHAVCDSAGGHCFNGACAHETSCADGIDNDGDGRIDCQDPQCVHRRCQKNGVCTGAGQCVIENCTNGIDDNGDGLTDCQDALVCRPPPSMAAPACCGVAWADTSTDVHHCGGCGTDCTAGHSADCGSIACVAGACRYGSAPDRTACAGGVCCGGNCVPDRETSCTDGVDNNCDGRTDCQDTLSCPAPGGLVRPACCGAPPGWTDLDHGDPANCGACGNPCPAPGTRCGAAMCNGGRCGTTTDCTLPGCDGAACTNAAGAPGQCAGGACCAGCVATDGTCQPGTDLHACVSGTGACQDCQPQNQCVTGACTGNGCQQSYRTGSCTVSGGGAGFCNQGTCCPASSCIDGTGQCQPISVAHCGTPGGACQAQSCNDGNGCTTDSCDASSGACVHTPLASGSPCSDGSAPGTCAGSACCLGCVDNNGRCVPQSNQSTGQCGTAGGACGACPGAPECQVELCTASGTCGTAPKPDGSSCSGGGTCQGGACIANSCGGNRCGGVCCGPGETCTAQACTCDQAACNGLGNICSPDHLHCDPPSAATCAAVAEKFCPRNNSGVPTCVSDCANFSCGPALFTCGGDTCLQSGVASTGNVCSDGVHPESCDFFGDLAHPRCSCDGNDRPGTCPLGASAVCETTNGTHHCATCDTSAAAQGLPCKGGGTCVSGACQ